MANKECPNCGKEIGRGAVNCPGCGVRVAAPTGSLVFLAMTYIIVGGLLAQDYIDRERSWVRGPLKRAREKRMARRSGRSAAVAARTARPTSKRQSVATASRAPRVVHMKREEVAITTKKPKRQGQKVMSGISKDLRIGARVIVNLQNGQSLTGTLRRVSSQSLDLQTAKALMTLNKYQLSTDSRIRFFDPDYKKHKSSQSGRYRVVAGPLSSGQTGSGTNLISGPKTDMGDVFMKAFD